MATPPDFVAGAVLQAAQLNKIGSFLIKTQTVGTGVTSVVVSDVFSADYENYRIRFTGGAASASTASLALTLGSTATGYYYAVSGLTFAGVAANGAAANTTAFLFGKTATVGMCAECVITKPFAADETGFMGSYVLLTTTGEAVSTGGYLNNTTSYTSFTISTSPTTLTGGTIEVYGLRD